jgi:hypothetical protein
MYGTAPHPTAGRSAKRNGYVRTQSSSDLRRQLRRRIARRPHR